jgi:predicted RNase H-like HicB family nuclease
MLVEAAVQVDMPLLADSGSDAAAGLGSVYTGVAVHEAGQWASLCPELDIASVGADADQAMNNLVEAVAEALAFASEEGLQPGHPTPPDDLRSFMVSGDAPFSVRKFYV